MRKISMANKPYKYYFPRGNRNGKWHELEYKYEPLENVASPPE